jgi:hypothetical protein
MTVGWKVAGNGNTKMRSNGSGVIGGRPMSSAGASKGVDSSQPGGCVVPTRENAAHHSSLSRRHAKDARRSLGVVGPPLSSRELRWQAPSVPQSQKSPTSHIASRLSRQVSEFSVAAFLALSIGMGIPKRFVYLLQSSRDPQQHYVGLTSDPVARLAGHNAGESPHTARGSDRGGCWPRSSLGTINAQARSSVI